MQGDEAEDGMGAGEGGEGWGELSPEGEELLGAAPNLDSVPS